MEGDGREGKKENTNKKEGINWKRNMLEGSQEKWSRVSVSLEMKWGS